MLALVVIDQALIYVKARVAKLNLAIVQVFKLNPAIVLVYSNKILNTACRLAGTFTDEFTEDSHCAVLVITLPADLQVHY